MEPGYLRSHLACCATPGKEKQLQCCMVFAFQTSSGIHSVLCGQGCLARQYSSRCFSYPTREMGASLAFLAGMLWYLIDFESAKSGQGAYTVSREGSCSMRCTHRIPALVCAGREKADGNEEEKKDRCRAAKAPSVVGSMSHSVKVWIIFIRRLEGRRASNFLSTFWF